MEILSYEPSMLPDVVSLYNRAVRDVPHCYPVRAERMEPVFAGAVSQEQAAEGMRDEAVLVAREGGIPLGFIHIGVGFPRRSKTGVYGVIRFFCCEPGRRQAGQALLDVAGALLGRLGMGRIATFDHHHRYPFYQLESSYLSERMDNIHALLGLNGYERVKGEVILEWRDYSPPRPAPLPVECEIDIRWIAGQGARPGVAIRAISGGEEIAICECESLGAYTDAAGAQDWFLTVWLGVEEQWQGKRLGRHLLECALREMRSAGYRHAVISTDWRNYRASVFYTNAGYRLSDWTYILQRDLSPPAGP